MTAIVTNFCTRCRTVKPVSSFHRDRSLPYGIESRCKECRKSKRRVHLEGRREYVCNRMPKLSESECWPWQGEINAEGYGRLAKRFRFELAHRATYELLVGPIPSGLDIDHLCFNRRCVNPKHMEPVTRGVNAARGVARRAKRLTADDVRDIKSSGLSQQDLAKRYAVSRTLIFNILHNRIYQWALAPQEAL